MIIFYLIYFSFDEVVCDADDVRYLLRAYVNFSSRSYQISNTFGFYCTNAGCQLTHFVGLGWVGLGRLPIRQHTDSIGLGWVGLSWGATVPVRLFWVAFA